MSAPIKKQYESVIKDHSEKLQEDIKRLKEVTQPISPDPSIGRLTRMDAINTKSINEANLHQAETRLGRLQNALNRLHHDDFGLCSECEEPISQKRLKILPETTVCMACIKERD